MKKDKLPAQIIIDILQNEMCLPAGNIWLRDQNKVIPGDDQLYAVVGMVDSHPFSNISEITPVTVDGQQQMQETQRVTIQENIQVDLFSSTFEAAQRAWEVIAAMHSLYSRQQQEANSFKIFRIPANFVNLSGQEGGSLINRRTLIIPVHAWYQKTKVLSQSGGKYYDDFTQRVDDAQTIALEEGLIEFEINSTGVH